MAKQTINPGTAPTGAGGDTFRSGSAKLQANGVQPLKGYYLLHFQ